jgi:FkbM family methyltransferase|tara:strand:+ start:4550 stop:5188 length:639 start_codon:yes stop_codon:yes gene_type:complete
MKYFLDLGAHKLEGLDEFTKKLNIDYEWTVYSYEPNIFLHKDAEKNAEKVKNKYKNFYFEKKAVLHENGYVTFNCHKGCWKNESMKEYLSEMTTGGNALNFNPSMDIGNKVVFDSEAYEVECISIDDILESICTEDKEAKIWIKMDIEGSEFAVIPCIVESDYAKHIQEMYIEWHERMWYHEGMEGIVQKQKERLLYTQQLEKKGIKCFVHH